MGQKNELYGHALVVMRPAARKPTRRGVQPTAPADPVELAELDEHDVDEGQDEELDEDASAAESVAESVGGDVADDGTVSLDDDPGL